MLKDTTQAKYGNCSVRAVLQTRPTAYEERITIELSTRISHNIIRKSSSLFGCLLVQSRVCEIYHYAEDTLP
jgi:hypothetical protein